ncbi:6-phosphogluconate dehydrogenase [Ensifer adhaerens]|uniref:6-phosphogluconate dehydrogenase n=1 Tax=Ensifer adhaerens TaxID=106592 RepID=A0ACC5T478_ENSAD|nr:6-phosphogluconate dehydrogenase [Ensifer adhaerens]
MCGTIIDMILEKTEQKGAGKYWVIEGERER